VVKPKVFVGSSQDNEKLAAAIADGLSQDAEITIWREGTARLNHVFLQDLIAARSKYDFAIMIWAADDVTESRGQSLAAPRDNVVFECGLFMGTLGFEHVFVVHDSSLDVKIPSDFQGLTLAMYDGSRMADNPSAAVRGACETIRSAISGARRADLEGIWRQRFYDYGEIVPKVVDDDIEIRVYIDNVALTRYDGPAKEVAFSARGRLNENRVRGEWQEGKSSALRGPFLLVVNTAGDAMYGYSVARDPNGGTVFLAWTLAKKDGRTEQQIEEALAWGNKMLKERTVGLLGAGAEPATVS
jgi:hypothetical protein